MSISDEFRQRYNDYLNSGKWKAKRQRKAEEVNFTCEKCGKFMLRGFHIHHLTYDHFMHERMSDLMFLCPDCHKEMHPDKYDLFEPEEAPKKVVKKSVKKSPVKKGKFFYQPIWTTHKIFNENIDYVDVQISKRVFATYREAEIYGKKYCPEGCCCSVNKLKLSKNINKNT